MIEEDLCYGDIPDTSSITVTGNNDTDDYRQGGSSSLMMAILIVIGVLSGCILVAGCIILVVLVKKLKDSSNVTQDTNVYTPGVSYRQVPTEPRTNLSSNRDCGKEHIYETIT